MRCGCPECGTYMIQSAGMRLGCVCPNCGTRCTDCLGTNTVISREALKELKGRDWFQWEKTERQRAEDEEHFWKREPED